MVPGRCGQEDFRLVSGLVDVCVGTWLLRFKEVAIRNNKLFCNVGFWTPTSIRSEATTQIIMIQHDSGYIYFSTVQVNMNYSCLESWIHGIFYTPRISLRDFVFTWQLSGSLDDWTSRGLNKNGSSQDTQEKQKFQVVTLKQFEIELIGALLQILGVHLAWSRI